MSPACAASSIAVHGSRASKPCSAAVIDSSIPRPRTPGRTVLLREGQRRRELPDFGLPDLELPDRHWLAAAAARRLVLDHRLLDDLRRGVAHGPGAGVGGLDPGRRPAGIGGDRRAVPAPLRGPY